MLWESFSVDWAFKLQPPKLLGKPPKLQGKPPKLQDKPPKLQTNPLNFLCLYKNFVATVSAIDK